MTRPTLFGLFDTHVAVALAHGLFTVPRREYGGCRPAPT